MDYNKLTVVKLKEELKTRGIASTGLSRKQQIIDRLVEEDAKQGGEFEADPSRDATESSPEPAPARAEETSGPPKAATEHAPDSKPQTEEKSTDVSSSKSSTKENTEDDNMEREGQAERGTTEHAAADATTAVQEEPQGANEANASLATSANGVETPLAPTEAVAEVASPPSDKKRKRRDASPSITEAEIVKKLKQDDTTDAHLDADVKMQADQEEPRDADQNADLSTDQKTEPEPVRHSQQRQQDEHEDKVKPETTNSVSDEVASPAKDAVVASAETEADTVSSVSPAIHPATSSLYVRNLKRPLQIQSFKQHLSDLAQEVDALTLFHLDAIRTHAFARFASVKAAARVRSRLHDQVWPNERDRESLWVDFVPDEKVEEWVAVETQGGESGRGSANMRRWEVAYSREQDDSVTATLQEASEVSSRQPFYSDNRAAKEPRALPPPPPPESIPEEKQPAPVAFANLDQRFKSTAAKPKLYWQPVAQKLADARLDEIDAVTTRRGTYPDSGSGWSDSRRYTFEDGDRLVDGGPEFGLRQGRSRAGPSARRGRQGVRGRGGDGWR